MLKLLCNVSKISGWAKPAPGGLTVHVLVNVHSIMHIVFQLYDVLRFESTAVINVLTNISSPKLNNQIFLNFEA